MKKYVAKIKLFLIIFDGRIDFFNGCGYTKIMELYEHINQFKIKFCDVDFKDEIKISALLSYLEEVSCTSADELGFGYEYIKGRNCAFFVTNYYLECVQPITLADIIEVKTWPTPPSSVIFGREYQISTRGKGLQLNATSRWCLLDMQTGKILPAKTLDNQDYSTYNSTKLFSDMRWKIPTFALEESALRFVMTIANSEYDHNMHVNNTRYADYCMNCFSVTDLSRRKLKSFALSFVRQCKEGETLRFYLKQSQVEEYFVQGVNEQEEIVVQARINFAEGNNVEKENRC